MSDSKVKIAALHQSYKRLSELIGVEAMQKVYDEFRGTQVQYPMRFYGYSQRWMKEQLKKKAEK